MKRCPLFGACDLVVNGDGDDISPICFDGGARKLAVDENYVFLVPIWCDFTSRNCEVVDSSRSYTRRQTMRQKIRDETILIVLVRGGMIVVWAPAKPQMMSATEQMAVSDGKTTT